MMRPPAPRARGEREMGMAEGSTSAQLKNDIDTGATGSKVAAPDPGASPLGTDAEAGGHPASPEEIAHAREMENRPKLAERDAQRPVPAKDTPAPSGRIGFSATPLVMGVGAGVLAAVALAAILGAFLIR